MCMFVPVPSSHTCHRGSPTLGLYVMDGKTFSLQMLLLSAKDKYKVLTIHSLHSLLFRQ